jgi:hypothetical protein
MICDAKQHLQCVHVTAMGYYCAARHDSEVEELSEGNESDLDNNLNRTMGLYSSEQSVQMVAQ